MGQGSKCKGSWCVCVCVCASLPGGLFIGGQEVFSGTPSPGWSQDSISSPLSGRRTGKMSHFHKLLSGTLLVPIFHFNKHYDEIII